MGALKRSLKAKNVLYKDLAKALKLSESSVKRILASKSLSLERLEAICNATDISFAEVCRAANFEEGTHAWMMNDEQEKALAENPRLLHYYMLLHDGKTPQKVEKEFEISSAEAKKFLFQLDRLNLIELHPRDRVKIKRRGSLRFRREGAVGRVLFAQTKSHYLNYEFGNIENDFIRFSLLHLSVAALAKFRTKLERLTLEIQEESRFEKDTSGPLKDIGILLSFRPWQYSYMDSLKKRTTT